ncbi:zinc-dependent alcohol dehydrogenase [Agathobaculum sp.]|uniref:zinc-dependent alcohol dehydrogenase n=1 Tax=Agathobaculum sp. TaxID=2048138 RepID=UPI002A7EC21D|nr:zinc-binding dehydrogenase [Agathobaculum sp.]MDY3619504.1 zinc-binding dehydrogenase [Agathobaculum sp.]
MELMKAVAVLAAGDVRVVDNVPKPVPGDYEALIRVHACGFCSGTDSQIIGGTLENGFGGYPTVLGHEGAGEVVAVGKKVRHIKVGERFIHPNLHPDVGNGYSKTHGSMAQFGLVCDREAMLEDGFAEADIPFPKQHKFPDSISFVDAGVLLSLAECHSAAKNFGAAPGMDILIYGAGPMGIALAMFCKLRGADTVVQIDSVPDRLEQAKRVAKVDQTINFAAENVDEVLAGRKFDLVMDAVGFTSILYEGSGRLKPGGKVCSLGVLRTNDLMIDTSRLQCNTSLHMLNFPYGEYAIMDETIALIESGKVDPKDFYSHVVSYNDLDEVLRLVREKIALKVILTFDD